MSVRLSSCSSHLTGWGARGSLMMGSCIQKPSTSCSWYSYTCTQRSLLFTQNCAAHVPAHSALWTHARFPNCFDSSVSLPDLVVTDGIHWVATITQHQRTYRSHSDQILQILDTHETIGRDFEWRYTNGLPRDWRNNRDWCCTASSLDVGRPVVI